MQYIVGVVVGCQSGRRVAANAKRTPQAVSKAIARLREIVPDLWQLVVASLGRRKGEVLKDQRTLRFGAHEDAADDTADVSTIIGDVEEHEHDQRHDALKRRWAEPLIEKVARCTGDNRSWIWNARPGVKCPDGSACAPDPRRPQPGPPLISERPIRTGEAVEGYTPDELRAKTRRGHDGFPATVPAVGGVLQLHRRHIHEQAFECPVCGCVAPSYYGWTLHDGRTICADCIGPRIRNGIVRRPLDAARIVRRDVLPSTKTPPTSTCIKSGSQPAKGIEAHTFMPHAPGRAVDTVAASLPTTSAKSRRSQSLEKAPSQVLSFLDIPKTTIATPGDIP